MKASPGGAVVGAFQLGAIGKGDRVDQDVNFVENSLCFSGDDLDVFVAGDIAGFGKGCAKLFSQWAGMFLNGRVVAEAKGCTLLLEGTCNPPGDAAFVGQAKNQGIFTS